MRKWIRRFDKGGYQALEDESRKPHHSPNKTPPDVAEKITKLKAKYKHIGAEHIKKLENLSISAKTIRKIWRENGVSKKHITKRNLREVKKQFSLFERACEDTKDLNDIPEYWPQMIGKGFLQVQYTFREISCGVQFLGFADERSLVHATLFAEYVNEHLKKYGLLVEGGIRQTDNESEYIRSWSAKEASSYTKTIESASLFHKTIPPGAHRFQADVETVHNLIEVEFYKQENFADRNDFMQKAYTY